MSAITPFEQGTDCAFSLCSWRPYRMLDRYVLVAVVTHIFAVEENCALRRRASLTSVIRFAVTVRASAAADTADVKQS